MVYGRDESFGSKTKKSCPRSKEDVAESVHLSELRNGVSTFTAEGDDHDYFLW